MKQKLLSFLVLCSLLIGVAHAQNQTVTGRVTSSEDNTPLSGVSVSVVGTSTATQTNNAGNYSISVPANSVLEFSSVGHTSQRINVGNQTVINVSLISAETDIDEVLVQVPYGTVRRSAFVGSETTIGTEAFENQRVTSFTKALEGLVPGLVSTNGGGAPGSNADVRIRGIGSISAGSGPLYVLDGVPYLGSNVSINNDDIESVTVLKDASATALYGARGANGVIMITTKKGSAGAPQITANIRTGFQNRGIPEYKRVNSEQYYEMMWHATRNRLAGGDPANFTDAINQQASEQLIPGLIYNVTNVANNQIVLPNGQFNPAARILYQDDWEDALTQTPFRQDYNLNVRGGSNTGNYFISLGHINEPGVAKFSGYERYTGRINVDSKPKDWLTMGLNMDGALGNVRNVPSGGTSTINPFYFSRQMGPIYPVWERDANGDFVIDPATGQNALDWGVPWQMGERPYAGNANLLGALDLDNRSSLNGNINANTFLAIDFLDGFTFRTTLGGNYYNAYGTTYQNSQFGDAQNVSGRSTKQNNRQLSFTFNQVLSYNKILNDLHDISALVGHESYQFRQNFMSATRTDFPFPGIDELAPAATLTGGTSYEHNHRIESYFSNFQYSYDKRYLLSASVRGDGNSRFFPGGADLPNAQWGTFWSVGAGWLLSNETFLSNTSWIDELKLKASYGRLGNEDLNTYYAWQSLYALGWPNANNPGAIISSLPAQTLSWESNNTFNAGVDFRLFDNRLLGTLEWYNKETTDMLFYVPLPRSTGIAGVWQNAGDMRNQGFDISLGYHAVRSQDFNWRVNLNLTHFRNKITRLPEENREDGIIDGTKRRVVGGGIYDFWLREYAGVDPANGDALYYRDVLDADGNATGERETVNNINQGDFYWHGTSLPDFTGGLQNTFSYKGVTLQFLVNFSKGGQFYDGNYASLMHVGSYGTHWHEDILNAWKQPGDITDVPRVQNALANQSGTSSRFLYDASYINIKNLTLSYRLPNEVAQRLYLNNVTIHGNVDNLHLFSSRYGMDPQRAFTGVSDWTYMPVRTFTFGVSIGL